MPSLRDYKLYFSDKRFLVSLALAFGLLATSLFINFYAGTYATERASVPVTDIVLSNTRIYDLDAVFIYGFLIFWFFVALLGVREPWKLPFILKATALFVLIRSVFITLTHLGPFPNSLVISPSNVISYFTFGGDLFFSGHTGLPFLMALVFWSQPRLRWLFIITAIIFGTVVLLAHLHYSIDVLSAFFITYTIYHLALVFFKKDHQLFLTGQFLL